MKNLRTLQGGYPRQMDYMLTLQNELMTVTNAMFGKLGQDMVLSGCEVLNNGNGTVNIAAGLVFVGGEVIRFDGASNITADLTKAFVKDAPVSTDPRTFGDGIEKPVYTEVKAIIGNRTTIKQIAVNTELYTLATYIRDTAAGYAVKGEYKDIYDFDGSFLQNFDNSGLGITARYADWALDNGNNGTPGSIGRVLIGAGTYTDLLRGIQTVYSNGTTGGEKEHRLTIAEMPNHSHPFNPGDNNGRSDNANDRDVMLPGGTNRTTGSTGGDQYHNNMQPYLAVYRIIKIR